MYKPLADNTLMGMTKKEIIEQLRIAEHNYQAMKETVNQQAENVIKLLAEERKHGHWVTGENEDDGDFIIKCSICGKRAPTDGDYRYYLSNYCPHCGATMDEEVQK